MPSSAFRSGLDGPDFSNSGAPLRNLDSKPHGETESSSIRPEALPDQSRRASPSRRRRDHGGMPHRRQKGWGGPFCSEAESFGSGFRNRASMFSAFCLTMPEPSKDT